MSLEPDALTHLIFEASHTTFVRNKTSPIHRWFFYPEGFSGEFVELCIEKSGLQGEDVVLDPFVGSGTTLVSSKLKGIDSIGIDISPLMCFVSRMKTNLEIDTSSLRENLRSFTKRVEPILLSTNRKSNLLSFTEGNSVVEETHTPRLKVPSYPQMERYFSKSVMNQLLLLKENILNWKEEVSRDFLKLAFASILVDVSNMKRMPDLTYSKLKKKPDVLLSFRNKVEEIYADLRDLRSKPRVLGSSSVLLGNAKNIDRRMIDRDSINLIVTSPPYLGHGDYVKNTKIELWFLDFVTSEEEMKALRNNMIVATHRISKEKLREKTTYSDQVLEDCCQKLAESPPSWFPDAHYMIRRFFDDMYRVFIQMYNVLKPEGCCVFVVGDSQFASIPVPTHIICSNIATKVGFRSIELKNVRRRRTGAERKTKGGVNLNFELGEYILIGRK